MLKLVSASEAQPFHSYNAVSGALRVLPQSFTVEMDVGLLEDTATLLAGLHERAPQILSDKGHKKLHDVMHQLVTLNDELNAFTAKIAAVKAAMGE